LYCIVKSLIAGQSERLKLLFYIRTGACQSRQSGRLARQ